jgi:hypothetical protein
MWDNNNYGEPPPPAGADERWMANSHDRLSLQFLVAIIGNHRDINHRGTLRRHRSLM